MGTHSSILAWDKTPWTEEPGGLQSRGRKESDMTEREHPTQDLGTWPSNPITIRYAIRSFILPMRFFISLSEGNFPVDV